MNLDFIKCYSEYLFKVGYQEADKFKNSKIPNILYKYFPCSENRINSLSRQELWLAQHENFNDPNEFKFMYIDKDKFENARLDRNLRILSPFYDDNIFRVEYQDAKKVMEKAKKIVSVSCFTTDPQNDYFWTNYANNHNGFCIKYNINKKDNFYPVIYTDEKLEISDILKTIIVGLKKNIQDEDDLMKEFGRSQNIINYDLLTYTSFLYFNYCCKNLKWEKEDEYRLVLPHSKIQSSKGKLITYDTLDINANKIFIGNNCSDENKKKLIEISKDLDIKYDFA